MNKKIKTIALLGVMLATMLFANAQAETIVTSQKTIQNKIQQYEAEVKQLRAKKGLGLDVDNNAIDLLDYKIDELYVLNGKVIIANSNGKTFPIDGATGLINKYANAKSALDTKTISQEEYTVAVSKIQVENYDLIKKLDTIVALITKPSYSIARTSNKNEQKTQTTAERTDTNNKIKNVSDTIELGRQFRGLMGI